MSTQERAPERPRPEAQAEATTPAIKPAAPAVPVAVLPPAAAFVTAGVCSTAAGYLATTVNAFVEMHASLGVELPWLTSFVTAHREALPVSFVIFAGALLALGGWRRLPSEATTTARALAGAAALAAGAFATSCVTANVLVFYAIQRALQD